MVRAKPKPVIRRKERNHVKLSVETPIELDRITLSLLELCRRVAECLKLSWHLHLQTRHIGNCFLTKEQATVRHKLPVFPDFVTELTWSRASPKSRWAHKCSV